MKQLKSKKHYKCILNDDKIIDRYLHEKENFNQKGELIQLISYSSDGKSYEVLNHKYNETHLIETEQIDLINDALSKQVWIYENDKLITERTYFNETDYIDLNYHYDSKGQLLKLEKIDNESVLLEYETFTYNEKHNYRIGEFYQNDLLIQTTKTYYNNDENAVEIISKYFFYDFDLSIDEVLKHEIIESYTFHNKDQVSSIQKFKNGLMFYESQFFLNEYKDFERISIIDDGTKNEFHYFYDDKHRSIREEEYINDKLQSIIEITYDKHNEAIEKKLTTQVSEQFYEINLYQSEPIYWK